MKNMPFNVLRHRDWDRAPRDPVTVGAAILGANVGTTALIFGLTGQAIVGYLVTTVITSWALAALAPKPSAGSLGSRGILVNTREPAAPHQFVYGQMRKGGTITYLETTGETNEYLHMIVALAGHPVDQIGDIYIDDQVVTWDQATGNVTDAFLDADSNPTIRIQKFDGTQTTAPADLLAESELTGADALTSAFVGNNIAYLYIRMKYDQSAYPNGIPLFTAVVRGKRVFDPRTSTTAWSDNAALCIRDYLTSAYGLSDSNVDDTAFSAAANISDELVTLAGLGTVKRYTVNGIVTADTSHGDVLGQMVTACAGTLFWGTGKWKLTVADYVAPTKTLTLDDLRSPISLQTRNNLRDQFNVVQGTFIDAENRWITEDYPPIFGAGFIVEDGNVEQPLDLELPFTTNSATAQRLAKLTLYRGREQMTFAAEFGMSAFDIEVGEIIDLDMPRYGWTGKEFEVIGWQLKANEDAGDLRVALTLRETSEAAFDWNAEESEIIGNNTNLPDPAGGLTINNLTASGGGRTQGDGTFINSAILNWDDASNVFLDHYEVEWKPLADSVYSATTTEQSDIEISPVIDGVEYIFRVRAVTVAGVKGPYASVQLTGGGDVGAPGLPTSISATGGFEYITISWTNPTDRDFNYVEIWESDTNNSASATRIGISGGDNFQRTNLGINVLKWYFLKSVDYSGNASGFTSGVSATTTFIDDNAFENGVYSLFTEQGLYAIDDVDTLPVSGTFEGQKVYNRTDGKLYRWSGVPSWTEVSVEAYYNNNKVRSPYNGQIIRDIAETLISSGPTSLGFDVYNGTVWSNRSVTVYSNLPATPVSGEYAAVTQGDEYIFAKQTDQDDVDGIPVYEFLSVSYGTIAATSVNPFQGKYYYKTDTNQLYEYVGSSWVLRSFTISTNVPNSNGSTIYRLPSHKVYFGRAGGSWQPIIADTGTISADRIEANSITAGLIAASGVITNSAQINDAIISNAKIQNLAVDTIKVANDAITRHNFSDFANQTGAGTHTFNFNTTMDFPGSIVAQAFINSLGEASVGDSLQMSLSIFRGTSSSPGTLLVQKVYELTGGGAVGLYPITVFADISSADISANSGNFYARVQTLTSGVVDPEVDVSVLLLRRFK